MASTPEKIVIDVDVGMDDYMALLLLLQAEKLGQILILGIICTMGNTKVDNVLTNVVRLLELTNRTDIPVYRGTDRSFIRPSVAFDDYFGQDGFCDLDYDTDPDLSIVSATPGALALGDLLEENSGQITLIALAPLTNVALASKIYGNFDNFKEIWIMGSNIKGAGNVPDFKSEFNFYIDPESVYVTFDAFSSNSSSNIEKFIFPWETCEKSQIALDWLFFIFGAKTDPPIALFIKAAKKFFTELQKDQLVWIPCDAYIAASYLNRDILNTNGMSVHNVSIELNGRHTRGQMLQDLDEDGGKMVNATLIEDFDVEKFKQILLNL